MHNKINFHILHIYIYIYIYNTGNPSKSECVKFQSELENFGSPTSYWVGIKKYVWQRQLPVHEIVVFWPIRVQQDNFSTNGWVTFGVISTSICMTTMLQVKYLSDCMYVHIFQRHYKHSFDRSTGYLSTISVYTE